MTWTDAPGMAATFAAHDRLRGELTYLERLTARGDRNPPRHALAHRTDRAPADPDHWSTTP
ncbi:hypothetical protein [Nonomuraea candida]|uniref:hypothetical protein n=1 Tax=Nonomuraea candida TaxID=359159 RepID=UPI0005B9FE25|nr:hypothetical protein [Nonomuraea candida]